MKLKIAFLIIFLSMPLFSHSDWEILTQGDFNSNFYCFFINSQKAFIVDNTEFIYFSEDGGNNWNKRLIDSKVKFKSVSFSDSLNGWLGGNRIYRTTDGGITWEDTYCDLPNCNGYVYAGSDSSAFLYNSSLYSTKNYGKSWKCFIPRDVYYSCDFVFFKNWSLGFGIVKVVYSVYPNYDDYQALMNMCYGNCIEICLIEEKSDYLYFINEDIGWIRNSWNGVKVYKKTTDGGKNITVDTVITKYANKINSIYFINPEIGWLLGNDGFLMKTIDGGLSWNVDSLNTDLDLYEMYFIEPNHLWIRCENSTLLYNHNFSSIYGDLAKTTIKYYPNPFDDYIRISYSLQNYSNINIKLIDELGREIALIDDGLKTPGYYSLNFNASLLSTGVYYILYKNGHDISSYIVVKVKQ